MVVEVKTVKNRACNTNVSGRWVRSVGNEKGKNGARFTASLHKIKTDGWRFSNNKNSYFTATISIYIHLCT